MARTSLIFLFTLFTFGGFSQQSGDTLYINYFVEAPFAYVKDDVPTGIEIDLVNEYVLWMKTSKNMSFPLRYVPFTSFEEFYTATKKSSAKNTIGLGGITITPERSKEVDMLSPFLKNVAFLITNGNAPDIKTKVKDDIIKALGPMTALTMTNTTLNNYLNELRKAFLPDLKIKDLPDQKKILDEISRNVLTFGYVEAIEFWFYLKSNPQKFLKMQKPLNQTKEELAFIAPKGSPHKALFNEFFSGATGFKTTRNYRAILEKYVGSYMTQNMAIN